MKPPRRRWMAVAVVLAVVALLAAVFGAQVWHAADVCADQHGRWDDGECHFDADPAVVPGLPPPPRRTF